MPVRAPGLMGAVGVLPPRLRVQRDRSRPDSSGMFVIPSRTYSRVLLERKGGHLAVVNTDVRGGAVWWPPSEAIGHAK